MAALSPSGRETMSAKKLVIRVEVASGQMPNWRIAGCQWVPVRKPIRLTSGLWKKSIDSLPSTSTMPTVVTIDKAPQMRRKPRMSASAGRIRRLRSINFGWARPPSDGAAGATRVTLHFPLHDHHVLPMPWNDTGER